MSKRERELGFRTSIQIPEDVETIIQDGRTQYKKTHGFAPSRSAMMSMMLRAFSKEPNWIRKTMKNGALNGHASSAS